MLNRFVFSIQNFDSASLSMLSSIIHKFTQAGEYHCTVKRGDDIVGRFSIAVTDNNAETASCSCQIATQANIDLKALDLPSTQHFESQMANCFELALGGYAVFHVSNGAGGYSVEIDKIGHETKALKVFDSRQLKEDDLYAVTVLRPGKYSVLNEVTKAKAELTVAYPERGKISKQPQSIHIKCGKDTIEPNKIHINPTEPIVFHFATTSRLKLILVEPEDRPNVGPTHQATQKAELKTNKKIKRRLRIRV